MYDFHFSASFTEAKEVTASEESSKTDKSIYRQNPPPPSPCPENKTNANMINRESLVPLGSELSVILVCHGGSKWFDSYTPVIPAVEMNGFFWKWRARVLSTSPCTCNVLTGKREQGRQCSYLTPLEASMAQKRQLLICFYRETQEHGGGPQQTQPPLAQTSECHKCRPRKTCLLRKLINHIWVAVKPFVKLDAIFCPM